mmetsp:Transcript_39141/g.101320  ORF Transcript_39141/g.101320 Transcript_39141/m.101320 type:complete len:410 (+) Transcript_39141:115-1344(+)
MGKETGTVTAWNMARAGKKNAEGYGFVQIDGHDDSKQTNLFLYADNIKDSKLRSEAKIFGLKMGTRITFKVEEARSARQSSLATEVEPLRDGSGGGGGGGGGAGGLEVNDVGLPLRAHAEACPNYMTAGACHHGPGCTFNHPSNVGPGMDLTLLNSSGYPLNDGAPTCMFFSKTGICKYGATCFKSHPEGGEGAGGGPGAGASFGGGGFGGGGGGESPSRPGQPPCTFFMKTGTCKFGATCRFDHPTNGSQSYSDPSLPSRSAGGMGQAAPQNQGGYPSRPGQEACAFFMKTGTCKYSATCCFDHPAGQGGNGGGAAQGDYPRNPGQQNCAFYMKTGACKFGATCRFDHPPSQAGGDDGAGGASNGWPEQPTEPQQASYGGGGEQGWAADAGDASNQEWSQVPGWGDQV